MSAPNVRDHRNLHAFSRPGRELIRLPGLAWLRELRWPVASAVLEGEAVAGDGSEGTIDLTIGEHLALICWGVMPSGMLRHPVVASS